MQIESLINEKKGKEQEIKDLLSKTALDLWKSDLDAFLVQWEVGAWRLT